MAIPQVRRLTLLDLDTVIQIQGKCYSTFFIESKSAIQNHIACEHPCWLVELDGTPAGYLLGAQLRSDAPPSPIPLGDTNRPHSLESANWLYLHDLAIDPDFQGRGASQALLAAARQHMHQHPHLQTMALVAVQDATEFWKKQGFKPMSNLAAPLKKKLATYGKGACYMCHHAKNE